MYVQCERCKTEYDFDDTLVSERGTTVKCTQCGHQFKVRRTSPAGSAEESGDRWVVTTVSGKMLVFTSLRELQKAILGKQVARSDSLARGSSPPRLLGAIAELEPFFEKRASVPPPGSPPRSDEGARAADPEPATHRNPARVPLEPVRPRIDTLRPLQAAPPPPPSLPPREPARSALAALALADPPKTAASDFATQPAPVLSDAAPRVAPTPYVSVPPAPVYAPASAVLHEPDLPPPTPPVRRVYDHGSIPDEEYAPPRRRVGGWIVGLVLLGGVSVMGFVVARPYLMPGAKASTALAPLDPRAQQLLSDGERAFADGNLDGAKEDFDKASVLVDKDPRVLLDLALVAEARADVAWLAMRLGGEAHARKDLDELSVKASAAADVALAATPDDPAAVRSKIDALRIAGDLAQARALVAKIAVSSVATQPQTEYELAALDLAEPAPPTPQAVDRLRDAASAESGLGRARAALVYALARAGDGAGARRELEKLLTLPRQHPLLPDLRALVDRTTQGKTGVDAGPVAVVDLNAMPANPSVATATTGTSDPRLLNQQADAARAKGDYARARELYGRVLAASPNDSEALAGLGDCAYAQRDMENAKTYYKRALDANSTYTPAMIGLADTEWETGDHAGAQKVYKEIVDRLPEAMVPPRAKQRAEGGSTAPAQSATAAADAGAAP